MNALRAIGRPSFLYVGLCLTLYAASLFWPDTQHAAEAIAVEGHGKATLDYLAEITKLAATLNSAMFSAAAALAVKGKDWTTRWGTVESVLVVFVLVLGAISYYGIYAGHVAILGMIYAGAISLFEPSLRIALFLQYYATLIGLFLVGLIFSRMLEEKTRASVPPSPGTDTPS